MRTWESDGADAIKWCQEKNIQQLTVKFNPKKGGWSVDQKYCCPKHAPKEILNPRKSKEADSTC